MSFVQTLKDWRTGRGYTMAAAAEVLGVTESSVWRWEHDSRGPCCSAREAELIKLMHPPATTAGGLRVADVQADALLAVADVEDLVPPSTAAGLRALAGWVRIGARTL